MPRRGRSHKKNRHHHHHHHHHHNVSSSTTFGSSNRMSTYAIIGMIVVIFEFQGIHKARIENMRLQQMYSIAEQTTTDSDNVNMLQPTALPKNAPNTTVHTTTANMGNRPKPSFETLPQNMELKGHEGSVTQPIEQLSPHVPAPVAPAAAAADDIEKAKRREKMLRARSKLDLPQRDTTPSVALPEIIDSYLGDLSSPYDPDRETPFFWHIPKAGGTSIKHMYSDCYRLVEACKSGIAEGHKRDITLKIVQLENGWKFVNIDVTTLSGLERAARFNLATSRKAQLVVSPLFQEATPKVFSRKKNGRMFALFRDPLERVVSLFYYLQNADWEPTYNPALKEMSLESYVNSTLVESNFVTRTLVNKMEAPLEEGDFDLAKEILRRKCLIGLLTDLEESVRRYDIYFGFKSAQPVNQTCLRRYQQTGINRHSHPVLSSDSPVYNELAIKNHMDMRLYKFAQELFREQANIFAPVTTLVAK